MVVILGLEVWRESEPSGTIQIWSRVTSYFLSLPKCFARFSAYCLVTPLNQKFHIVNNKNKKTNTVEHGK